MSAEIKELLQFLQLGARSDIKNIALNQVLSLTATDEGIESLIEVPESLLCLLILLSDNKENIQKNSALSLVNVAAHRDGPPKLLDLSLDTDSLILKPPENIVKTCVTAILRKDSRLADECCMILSNVTCEPRLVERVVDLLHDSAVDVEKLADAFARPGYNDEGASLDHLGSVLANLSQSERVRARLLDRDKSVISRLLPFVGYEDSAVRRRGAAAALRNCCFETGAHGWLLSEDGADVLPRILLPLADGTELDEADNDGLPVELQFLPEGKRREGDAEIRCILLESLNQLCALRENREYVRGKNAYVILRELHKWEEDPKALLACENCVDILIRTEQEIDADNLREVDIPADIKDKLDKFNESVNKTV